VLVVDPFGYGEATLPGANLLTITNALGERPLGIAASEVAAIARMLAGEQSGAPQLLAGVGRQASVVALVAATLEPAVVGDADLTASLQSLTQLLDPTVSVYSVANLWTYGLLADADIADLMALVAPRPITVH
jgi:hypothetical protein